MRRRPGYVRGMRTFVDVAGDDTSSTRHRVLAAVRDHGPISRAELARRTGLAASTITTAAQSLALEGVLHEAEDAGEPVSRTGPRGRGLRVDPTLASVAGIDFGFRTVRVAVCDVHARALVTRESRLAERYSSEEGLSVAAELYRAAVAALPAEQGAVVTVGVALPGPIDAVRRRVIGSAVLPGWSGITAEELTETFGVDTVIENDANLAALGEHVFGAGRDVADSLTVKFHSGIGAGLIVRDRLVGGPGSGEIGHFAVASEGPVCRCGKRGCLDTFAAIPALLDAASTDAETPDVRSLLEQTVASEPRASRIVSDAAELVGDAASRACLLFAPQRVIVVGAMAEAGDAVLEPFARALRRGLIPDTQSAPEIVRGALAERSTVMGAVALALTASGWLPASG